MADEHCACVFTLLCVYVNRAKPKTLFMHASSKRLDGGADDGIFRSTANTTITRSDNSQPSTANTTKDSSI